MSSQAESTNWPNNSLLTCSQLEEYKQEVCCQFKITNPGELDPSIPRRIEMLARYIIMKNIDINDISDSEAEVLASDNDLSGVVILPNVAKKNRGKVLSALITQFTKWRELSMKDVRSKLNLGWLNLDTGWISDKPNADHTHDSIPICSDSKLILRVYAEQICKFNVINYTRYFYFLSLYSSNWKDAVIKYSLFAPQVFKSKHHVYYCIESGSICDESLLSYKNSLYQIGSNSLFLYTRTLSILYDDLPLGKHTVKITKQLLTIFCSPRCLKSQYYDLDTRQRVNVPNKCVYFNRQYRMFSIDEEFLRRVVKFYRKYRLPPKIFNHKMHPILYQYFTVIFVLI